MKNTSVILISFIITFSFFSCQKELEIEYPDIEPKLVVNCLFTPDSLFIVRVGKLLPLNDSTTTFIVDNAVCEISEDDIFAENLKYTKDGFYISETLKPQVGKVYTLYVIHPDLPNVTATDTVPEPVSVSETYFKHKILYDALDESYFHTINIRFQDNIHINNHYELKLLTEDSIDDATQIISQSFEKSDDLTIMNTGLLDYHPSSIPFSDKLFNGQNYFLSTYYKLPFESSDGEGNIWYNSHNLIVHFNSISYQYFQYSRKMIMHIRNQESYIFEWVGNPVEMYSNIENGYGIFAAYNPYIDTLQHIGPGWW